MRPDLTRAEIAMSGSYFDDVLRDPRRYGIENTTDKVRRRGAVRRRRDAVCTERIVDSEKVPPESPVPCSSRHLAGKRASHRNATRPACSWIAGKGEVGPDHELRHSGNRDPRRRTSSSTLSRYERGTENRGGAVEALTPRAADSREMASADIHPDRPFDDQRLVGAHRCQAACV
jgi:hypothetical protein